MAFEFFKRDPEGIDGLAVMKPAIYEDSRGYFTETYNKRDFDDAYGEEVNFVQDNQSSSCLGVLRGLHYQINHPQGKLVRVISGTVYDVAVDLRPDSPTFGKHYGVLLSDTNMKQFYVPEGFAHGFLVLTMTALFCYKVTDFYHPGDEGGIMWNDPEIAIQWPEFANAGVKLSEKDKLNLSFSEFKNGFLS